MDSTSIVIGLGTIVVLGVGLQLLARRVRVPAILLLIAAGLFVGPGLGVVDPTEIFGDSLFPVVSMAVSLLLFEGGLGLDIAELRERGARPVVRLVTLGVLVTWGAIAAVAAPLFGLSRGLALLLGALLVVSGPTVVGPLLSLARPRPPTSTILMWEGIVIDPVGATLALVVLKVITGGDQPVAELFGTAGAGILVGLAAAALLTLALRNFAVPEDLEMAVTFMTAIAAYAVAEGLPGLEEAGLFATTALGVALANQRYVQIRRIESFGHDIGVIVLGGLFVVLAANASPRRASSRVLGPSVAAGGGPDPRRPARRRLALHRPAATSRSPTALFIGALAPRGIVAAATSSLFVLRLQQAGMADGSIDSIVFMVIVGTCLVYGLSVVPLARGLGIAEPEPRGRAARRAPKRGSSASPTPSPASAPTSPSWPPASTSSTPRTTRGTSSPPQPSDRALDAALDDVGRALIASLDDEHNAYALARCLDRLARSDVYVLPADHRAPAPDRRGRPGRGRLVGERLEVDDAATRSSRWPPSGAGGGTLRPRRHPARGRGRDPPHRHPRGGPGRRRPTARSTCPRASCSPCAGPTAASSWHALGLGHRLVPATRPPPPALTRARDSRPDERPHRPARSARSP